MMAAQTIRSRIEVFCARDGGASNAEICDELGVRHDSIGKRLQGLEYQCRIFRGKQSGSKIRWFRSSDAARAYQPDAAPAKKAAQGRAMPIRNPGTAASVTLNFNWSKPTGEVAHSASIKITRGPSFTHDPRYQLPPDHKVYGGFAAAGIGRYTDEVGA